MYPLILAALGLSAAMIAHVIMRVAMRRYRAFRRRFLGQTAQDLDYLYADLQADQVLVLTILAMVALALIAILAGTGLPGLSVMLCFGYFLPRLIFGELRRRRIKKFDKQLVDAVVMISSCLRVGLNLHQAVRSVASEMSAPINEEFGLVLRETQLGEPIERAMAALARRMSSQDLDLVATAISVAHHMGGNLAEIFQNISDQIRDRNRAARKLESLTSAGRLQGLLVGIVPPLLFVWTIVADAERALRHYSSIPGMLMLGVVFLLYLLAFFAIRRLTQAEI